MLFNAPMDDEIDQQIRGLALKHLSDAGMAVNNVKKHRMAVMALKRILRGKKEN